MKSSPHLPQLEKARTQQQRPSTAKNKLINKFKKKKEKGQIVLGVCQTAHRHTTWQTELSWKKIY